MTSTQRIPSLQVCSSDKIESKGIIADETLSHVCSTDDSESEKVIINESFIEKIERRIFHKSINTKKGKYSIDETKDGEPLDTDNPVINEQIYSNIFKYGKRVLNNLDAKCE